jgi:hypothetical protein
MKEDLRKQKLLKRTEMEQETENKNCIECGKELERE